MITREFKNKTLFSFITLCILPLSGIAVDLYIPSLPAVSAYFGVNKALAQLSITTYLIGLGTSQLIGGSITDSFGRKIPFIISMIIFLISTLFIPWSFTIHQLLILRFVQGSAVGLTIVPLRSVISDVYEGRDLQKMISYMTLFWSIGPIVAPAIGGYLQFYFGWKSNFYFLSLYASVVFILALIFLPETSAYRHQFHVVKIIVRYFNILIDRHFLIGLLINSLIYSIFILFGVVAPFIIQSVLGYSAVQFGHIALLMGLFWFLGVMTNRFLLDVRLELKISICLISILFVSLAMVLIALLTELNIYNVVIPMLLLLLFGGIAYPNYFARNIILFPTMTGSANALFGSAVFLFSGGASAFGALLRTDTEMPLALTFVFIACACLILFKLDNAKDF